MGKKSKKTPPALATRGVLSRRKKQTLLAVVVRNLVVFEQISQLLSVSEVRAIHDAYGLVYKVVGDFYRDNDHKLPTKMQLLDAAQQEIEDNPSMLPEHEIDVVTEFVEMAFDPDQWDGVDLSTDETYAKLAREHFVRLKHDNFSAAISEGSHSGKHVPENLALFLQDHLHAVEMVASIQTPSSAVIFAPGWKSQPKAPIISTGLAVINEFLGGGYRRHEVVGLMLPYGGGKTTIAVQGLCAGAKLAKAMTESAINKSGPKIHFKTVLASYEMPIDELRERILRCLANIPSERLKEIKNFESDLRSGGEPLEYEKRLYKKEIEDGLPVPTELERVSTAEKLINEFTIFYDFTNLDPDKKTGTGGVGEMGRNMRTDQRRYKGTGKYKGYTLGYQSVWVDHAAAMVANMQSALEADAGDDYVRRTLKKMPKELGGWIAKRFNTPVMIMHQLSGAANARSPTARVHHTDGDECKSFGMYLDFAIVGGPPDYRNLCVWECTKHRREPARKRQIVRLHGELGRIICVDKKYVVDGSRIVTIAEKNSVVKKKPTMKKYTETEQT